MVILGAGGDVTSRYLVPALAELDEAGALPDEFEVVGVGRHEQSDDEFRRAAGAQLERGARVRSLLSYRSGDATERAVLESLVEGADGPVVLYLALPPQVFAPVLSSLAGVELPEGSTVVVEKPFGEDVESARELNGLVEQSVGEGGVFRIDHFLGHQTVQNLLGLRFANRLFEPVWNHHHVERVEIVWDETLTVEGRAGFYDSTGALKDMLQNHLLQLACLVAMEPPLSLDADAVRDRKVDVLRAVRRIEADDAGRHSVRGRYAAGTVGDRQVPDYTAEEGVDPGRGTETFAELELFVDNQRWSGVPFVLRTGKALGADRRHIEVTFKEVPHRLFDGPEGPLPERLTLDIEPDAMRLDLRGSGGGAPTQLEPTTLSCELAPSDLGAYATVLRDVIAGDQLLSIRGDEAEQAWRVVAPVVAAWDAGEVPLEDYPAGSAGPSRTLTT